MNIAPQQKNQKPKVWKRRLFIVGGVVAAGACTAALVLASKKRVAVNVPDAAAPVDDNIESITSAPTPHANVEIKASIASGWTIAAGLLVGGLALLANKNSNSQASPLLKPSNYNAPKQDELSNPAKAEEAGVATLVDSASNLPVIASVPAALSIEPTAKSKGTIRWLESPLPRTGKPVEVPAARDVTRLHLKPLPVTKLKSLIAAFLVSTMVAHSTAPADPAPVRQEWAMSPLSRLTASSFLI